MSDATRLVFRKIIGSLGFVCGAFFSGGSSWGLYGRLMMPSAPHSFLGMESVCPLALTMSAGGFLLNHALRILAPTAREVQKDVRAPIILLRSFDDDSTPHGRYNDGPGILVSHFAFTRWHGNTVEEAIAEPLSELGPVVTVADPRRKSKPPGATRIEPASDEWQRDVSE